MKKDVATSSVGHDRGLRGFENAASAAQSDVKTPLITGLVSRERRMASCVWLRKLTSVSRGMPGQVQPDTRHGVQLGSFRSHYIQTVKLALSHQ